MATCTYVPLNHSENQKIAFMYGNISFVGEPLSRAHFKDNFILIKEYL